MPGYNYDLGHAGKGPSDGWFFFTSYNSEQANTKLEENASKNDKDFIAAVNYVRAEECVAQGKAHAMPSSYRHNFVDEKSRIAVSENMPRRAFSCSPPQHVVLRKLRGLRACAAGACPLRCPSLFLFS